MFHGSPWQEKTTLNKINTEISEIKKCKKNLTKKNKESTF